MTAFTPGSALRFGPGRRFELHGLERRLLVDGTPASLGARAFDVLLALAARPGELLTKSELLEAVWPDVVVEENNLATQISTLRKVLGGEVIATIPGRGYRFTAVVEESQESAAEPARPAQPQAASGRPVLVTNLPERLPPLLGRADDLAALGALIDTHTLVTIVGAGGMGKTRLAQTLLHARRTGYRHGVCWVELATLNDAAALPAAIAAALAVDPGKGEPLRGLCAALSALEMLIVLDNVEQILEGTARVVQSLLDAAPGVRLIVTSQAPLSLAAERVYRLGALAVPQGALPAQAARDFGAVALFVERAQAADARFVLGDDNAPAVIELCHALDGLALAIELAAARAPMLGVQRLASSMHDRLKLLTTSRNRAAPARQQTLRAALEWSHGLLDERERTVFRRLAVFAGSASLAMIQKVAADAQGELDEWAVLDVLALLVDRSLVAVLSRDDTDAPRYRLLESARVFALERLEEAGETAALRRRHAQAFAEWGDAAWDESWSATTGFDVWRSAMALDLDNAREAQAWARGDGDPTTALHIGVGLLRALPDSMVAERLAMATLFEPLIEQVSDVDLQGRGAWAVATQYVNYDPRRAAALHAPGLDRIEQVASSPQRRWLRYQLTTHRASSMALAGSAAPARALLEDATALEDPSWPAASLRSGAAARQFVARAEGDMEEASRALRREIALAQASGRSASILVSNQIDLDLAVGDAAGAARAGVALIESLAGGRDERALAYARLNLSAAYLALDDAAAARSVLQAGWNGAAAFHAQPFYADYMALLAALEGRPRASARLIGYADVGNAPLGPRQSNEAAAIERATRLARAALQATEFERLRDQGSALRDADVAALAFASEDAP